MDGFGHNPSDYGNAITAAKNAPARQVDGGMPDDLYWRLRHGCRPPDGQMGNSEVGHTNIGAGRVVYQELTRITKSIADGEFLKTQPLPARAVGN